MIHKEKGYLIYNTKNYEIFHKEANVDDIIQGYLGDCYFLSVIGSLCNNIKIIEKLFYSLNKSKNNQYGVKKMILLYILYLLYLI